MDRLIVRSSSLRRTVAFSPVVLLLILGVACLLGYLNLRSSRLAVGRAREARLAAEEVISDLKDAETSQRGYLLLGDSVYLAPYQASQRKLATDTVRLRKLTSGSPTQTRRLGMLRQNIHDRLALIDTTIALRDAGQLAAAEAVVRSGHGLVHMNAIRRIVSDMDAEERDSLAVQLASERRSGIVLALIFTFGLVVVVFFGFIVNRGMLRYTTEHEKWLRDMEARNQQLQAQAAELEAQRDDLQEQAAELEAQQNELEVQNEELQITNEALHAARLEAEHANAAKSAFLTSMSHELRTPLNAIAGYTDLIEAGVYGAVSERLLDAARRIHINEEQLLSIINQILDYTGLKSQTQPIPLQTVDVVELLKSAEAVVAPMLLNKGLTFQAACESGERPCVLGNADRLRQVLVNLLGNAVKFTPAPGEVTVTCTQSNDRVRIAVRDTGIGIAASETERIFEPFVQVGAPASSPTNGVGLGLAISRELVDAMGGELSVESEPGVGSVFTITLRRAAPGAAENVARGSAHAHSVARAI